jgi:glutathione synthase/RimK-type ligase-like ATP-grasp enzyme
MTNGVLLQSANKLRLGLIGNPENRRIRDFQASAEALGMIRPECLSYAQLLADPASLDRFPADLIRVDSPGENSAVAESLIQLGGGPVQVKLQHGQIAFLREHHRGFCCVLDQIQKNGIPTLNAPADIADMFDKWRSHLRLVAGGVRRPPSVLAPDNFDALQAEMRARGHGRWFLKPLHGSSASGVCALRWQGAKLSLTAPLRMIASDGGENLLVNSLEVRTYSTEADIAFILGLLLPQGMIQEEWIPKLTLPDGAVDVRVLVIGGEARHWVARQSRHPMTNLHLGNQRCDQAELLRVIGEASLGEVFSLAEQAASCFPQSLYCGVDVLIDLRHRSYVAEVNAFGDLLPRLTHRGDSVYAAILKAAHACRCIV